MLVYKTYWFDGGPDGDSVEDMIKVYEGDCEETAMQFAELWESRDKQVEVWEGVEGDSTSDQLYYPQ